MSDHEKPAKPHDAGASLEEAARQNERKTEKQKGSSLKKDHERVSERAEASNDEGPVAD